MKMHNLHLSAVLLASALLAPASAQPFASAGITASPDQYADGTRAINDGRWADAVTIFSKIADARGDRADAALYWKAYAENKQGQQASALETCATLRRNYSRSRYISDCDALRVEIQGPSIHVDIPPVPPVPPIPPVPPVPPVHVDAHTIGRHHELSNPDEELKLLALQAVMQQDEARALPAIQQILNGNGSEQLKERALFVLAQSRSPQAQQMLGQIVRNQSNPALQIRAIRMYAAQGGKSSVDTLADIYKHTSDEGVKKTILQSYLITGSPDKLVEAAKTEQNPDLVRTAVRSLGAMGATSELLTLYRATNSQEAKASIIDSLIAAGHKGADALSTIASSEQNPDLRRKAIKNLGIAGGASAAPAIVSTYQKSTDLETKKAAADALFLAGDAHNLVALARAEKDPEARAAIVSKLSLMRNKEATDYMIEILNK